MEYKRCAVMTMLDNVVQTYNYQATDVYDIVDEVEAHWPDFEQSKSLEIFDDNGDTIAWLDHTGTIGWEYDHDYRHSDW
jgi:hypothetical protein